MGMTSFLDKSSFITIFVVLILLPLVSHAGGLGVAPLVFILGLFGLSVAIKTDSFTITKTQLALMAFLIWLCITALWSPYKPDDLLTNYLKLFLMVMVFYWSCSLFKYVAMRRLQILQHLLMAVVVFTLGLLVIDLLSNFGLTLLFNPASDFNDKIFKLIDAEMNLGHSITILTLLAAPVAMLMLYQLPAHISRPAMLLFLLFLAWAAWLNSLAVGLLGLLGVLIATAAGYYYPRQVPKALLILVIFIIITSPLISLGAFNYVGESGTELPQSWDHRLRMWAHCWHVIAEYPLQGAGFDASRTFNETFIARDGRELTIVSLHPHNVGVQIWTETGLIGALLATMVIVAVMKPVNEYVQSQAHGGAVSGVIMGALIISSLSYGAWQFWWWACVFFAVGTLYFLPTSKELALNQDDD